MDNSEDANPPMDWAEAINEIYKIEANGTPRERRDQHIAALMKLVNHLHNDLGFAEAADGIADLALKLGGLNNGFPNPIFKADVVAQARAKGRPKVSVRLWRARAHLAATVEILIKLGKRKNEAVRIISRYVKNKDDFSSGNASGNFEESLTKWHTDFNAGNVMEGNIQDGYDKFVANTLDKVLDRINPADEASISAFVASFAEEVSKEAKAAKTPAG